MAIETRRAATLQATLCEVERGVFYVTYPSCENASDLGKLTTYQMGTSCGDAKQSIERHARTLGYETVIWTETILVPRYGSQPALPLPRPPAIGIATAPA